MEASEEHEQDRWDSSQSSQGSLSLHNTRTRGSGPRNLSTERPRRSGALPAPVQPRLARRVEKPGKLRRKSIDGSSEERKLRTPSSEPHTSKSDDIELDNMSSNEDITDDEEAGLTNTDKRRRQRRRRRNTMLDERIVGETEILKEERKIADRSVLRKSATNAFLIGLWYIFSLSISIYNKWMFSPDHLNFHFPLFTRCMHMLVQFTLASLVLFFFPHFRPRTDSISNPKNLIHHQSRDELVDPKKSLMTAKFYLSRIGPCGAATGLDIGLGNMSLRFITLTFFTMCKSSALAFVLIFAFLFHLETPSVRLVLIILTMTIGVIMMVAGETAFNMLGFILIISSAFFSGFRWALTQILLLRNPATSNPFSTIFFLAPVMFLSLACLAIPIEGFPALAEGLSILTTEKGTIWGTLLLLFPGVLAFCMTSSEFALLQRTSVVTLSICGIFKEVVTISAAGIVFHDPLTPINISGQPVTIASIAAYNYIKIRKMRHEALDRAKDLVEGSPSDAAAAANDHARTGSGERARMLDPAADLRLDEPRNAPSRMSTSDMVREAVRSSLTLARPTLNDRIGDGRDRQSPTKRPADLE